MRVDTNESFLVQKALAIKGLRIAMEEKDSEIRSLRKKVSAIVYQAGLSPSVCVLWDSSVLYNDGNW